MTLDGRLSRYREIDTLGSGGMASVVLAEDTVLGRRVALKRLHPSATDPRALLRMRREALVGASLSHPNLVSIYDVIDSERGDAVIVMEYVHGETLRDALRREGRLEAPEALRVLQGMAGGLDAIHRRGIVHRDIKPANVLLGTHGSVKLADLGIASVPDDTRITTAGTVLGSFRYMAPEQLRDGPVTRAIDIYALAAVAFEVLSGRQARREANPLAVAHAIANQPPPDLRDAWPAAPAGAAEVLVRGMCRDSAGRPASAGELVARLTAALDSEPTAPVKAAPTLQHKRATPAGVVAATQAGVALAASSLNSTRRPPRAGSVAASDRRTGSDLPRDRGSEPSTTPGNAAAPSVKTFRASRRSDWGRVLAPLALAVVAGAVVLALVLSSRHGSFTGRHSSSTGAASKPAGSAGRKSSTGSSATSSTSSRPGSGSATSPAASARAAPPAAVSGTTSSSSDASAGPPAPRSPVGAVETFYELSAAHRYSDAWALADPAFRNQLGGYDSFKSGQAADRSITFDAARTVRQSSDRATVEVQTTSVRTTGTEHCAGTVQTVPGTSGRWLVHRISINCR